MAVSWPSPRRRHVAASQPSQHPRTPDPLQAVPQSPHGPLTGRHELDADLIDALTLTPALLLSVKDRRIIAAALDFQIVLGLQLGSDVTRHRMLLEAVVMHDPGYGPPVCDLEVPDTAAELERDLSRAQELRRDAIEAEFGRSAVRWQADGAVVITGLTDDIERVRVCVDRDGTERWRSR